VNSCKVSIERVEYTPQEWAARCPRAFEVMLHWLKADTELAQLGLVYKRGEFMGKTCNPGVVEVTSTKLDIEPINICMWGYGDWPVDYWNPDPLTGFDQALWMSGIVRSQILAGIGMQLAIKAIEAKQ
jgi:hypothetical protein